MAGEKPKLPVYTCDSLKSDKNLSEKDVGRKAVYLCKKDDPVFLQTCKTSNNNAEKELCKTVKSDSRKSKCCVQGKLSGVTCKDYGTPNKLPDKCKTACLTDGKIKVTKECRSCRGIDDLRVEEGKSGEDPAAPFDPARVQDSVEDIASKLNPE